MATRIKDGWHCTAGTQQTHKREIFFEFDALDMEQVRYIRVVENFSGAPPPNGAYE